MADEREPHELTGWGDLARWILSDRGRTARAVLLLLALAGGALVLADEASFGVRIFGPNADGALHLGRLDVIVGGTGAALMIGTLAIALVAARLEKRRRG